MTRDKAEVRKSSGNVFADLGRPDADGHMLKAQIVAELHRLVQAQKLTQAKAGEIMGITQPEVSRLFRGHFREYSIERLLTFLTAFNQDVVITAQPRARSSLRSPGQVSFKLARA
jgi:predicted XRE-type DNA-binding protein